MSTSTAFRFKNYTFTSVEMNMGRFLEKEPLSLTFSPSGVYDKDNRTYNLRFTFNASQGEDKSSIVKITCEASFEFKDAIELKDIPDYFYPNSLAIVFPYVRAFVSTVTLQANIVPPILIPTLNLTGLQSTLKENTTTR